jgi:hypothetical protein
MKMKVLFVQYFSRMLINLNHIISSNLVKKNDNSSLINDFKLIINENGTKNKFPSEFLIEFEEFNTRFSIKFIKQSKNDASYSVGSSDIYVIDEKMGQPVLYKDNEQIEVYNS